MARSLRSKSLAGRGNTNFRGGPPFVKIKAGIVGKDVDAIFGDPLSPVAKAAKQAVQQAADIAVARGKANIRAAGFPDKWVNSLQSRKYPKRGRPSINAEAFINYRMGGVGTVYEFGTTIRPKKSKLLWFPVSGIPGRPTPSQKFLFKASGRQRLFFARIDGKPYLVQYLKVGRQKKTKIWFRGIPQAVIKKRWNITPIVQQEAKKLGPLLQANLLKELRSKGNG